jgi:hypothetical protein
VSDQIIPPGVTLLRSESHVLWSVAGKFRRRDQLEQGASSATSFGISEGMTGSSATRTIGDTYDENNDQH